MTQFGPYLIVRKAEFPAWQKAHKLARTMTEDQVDDILNGRRHIHRNPRRRVVLVDEPGKYPVAGE